MLKILNPYQSELNEFSNLGAYAYNLACMAKTNKISMPTFICIPHDEIFNALDENTKSKISNVFFSFKNNEINIKQASQECIGAINNAIVPQEFLSQLSSAIHNNFQNVMDNFFVVKSSFYWNDNKMDATIVHNSVASCINVKYNLLADAILYAYSSTYTEVILKIIQESNFELNVPTCSVIIQNMLPVDVSGTIVPGNKLNYHINARLVNAKIGRNIECDEEIVENYCFYTSDTQYYTKGLSEYELLNEKQMQFLMQQANIIENEFAKVSPLNSIHFVISDEKVYILCFYIDYNERVTNIGHIFDGKSIEKTRKGASTNLTYSLFNDYEKRISKALFCNVYECPELYETNKDLFKNPLAFIDSNAYYDVKSSIALMSVLPENENLIPKYMEKMCVPPYMNIQTLNGNFGTISSKQKKILKTLEKNSKDIFNEVNNAFTMFHNSYNDNLDLQSLKQLYENLINSCTAQLAYSKVNNAFLETTTYEFASKLIQANVPMEIVNAYIKELLTLDESPMELCIKDIATLVKGNQGLTNILCQLDTPDKFYSFMQTPNDLTQKIQQFFYLYGNLTIKYNKIEMNTYNENPIAFVQSILSWQQTGVSYELQQNVALQKIINKKPYSDYVVKIKELLKNKKTFELYERLLNSKLRVLFFKIGSIYHNQGKLDRPFDIVHFDLEDIFNGNVRETVIETEKEKYEKNINIPTFNKITDC